MAPRKKHVNNNTLRPSKSAPLDPLHQLQDCYEGERLHRLLQSIQRKIESARMMDNSLPEKIWFKLQFAVGVNDVTRVLERMKPVTSPMAASLVSVASPPTKVNAACNANANELQAVLIAADSNPRWLTKHLPSLALSRNVPLIFLKDNKGASLRLGQLVKLRTAIAIGVKEMPSIILSTTFLAAADMVMLETNVSTQLNCCLHHTGKSRDEILTREGSYPSKKSKSLFMLQTAKKQINNLMYKSEYEPTFYILLNTVCASLYTLAIGIKGTCNWQLV